MEDNLKSADPLSDTTNGSTKRKSERLLPLTITHSTASCGAPDTDREVSNSSSNNPLKTIEEGVLPLPSYTANLTRLTILRCINNLPMVNNEGKTGVRIVL